MRGAATAVSVMRGAAAAVQCLIAARRKYCHRKGVVRSAATNCRK